MSTYDHVMFTFINFNMGDYYINMHAFYTNMQINDGIGDIIILTSELFMSTFNIKNMKIGIYYNFFQKLFSFFFYMYPKRFLISGYGITEVYQTFKI